MSTLGTSLADADSLINAPQRPLELVPASGLTLVALGGTVAGAIWLGNMA